MVTEVSPRPVARARTRRPAPAAGPRLGSELGGRAKSRLATTPGRLRLASFAIIAAVVIMWVAGATTVAARQSATRQVGLESEPLLVGAQSIYASMADADATAANAFLTGGLEPASLGARYDADIKQASDRLADVTRQVGSASDATTAVRTMTDQLPVYAGLVEAARANNRQGFPVGAAYLREASTLMRSQILVAADQLYQLESRRLDSSYRSGASNADLIAILVGGLLAIVILIATQLYLLRRTNRVFNVALLVATALTIVLIVWVSGIFVVEHHHLAQARRAGSDPVKTMAQARILALKAQSDESLTLIARGNGQKYSTDFDAIVTQLGGKDGNAGLLAQASQESAGAQHAIDVSDVVASYKAYLNAHQRVRAAADSGKFSDAVTLATGTAAGDEGPIFTQLDNAMNTAINNSQQQFVRQASAARNTFGLITLGLIVLAVAIGLLALLGTQQRINDYR
jgi:hypothetical protein